MIRSSLGGMLSPIKELPLKERAAERGEDDEYEEEEVVEEDEEEEDDEEQLLAAADALGRRMHSASFQMMPLEIEATHGGGGERASPYLAVLTQEPPLAPSDAPETPQRRPSPPTMEPSTGGGSGGGGHSHHSASASASHMVGEILASPRGGFECPFPPPFDEEHPDPCEFFCKLLRMPRVPDAPTHYLIYRSRSTGRIYALGPHWAGLVFTVCLICVASSMFIKNVCLALGPGYVAASVAYTALTLLTLLRTACLDPGFVTRSVPESQFPRRRYCSVCRIYTAPDAAHCDDCKVCVDRCDHHCPWTGHCIGRGNMGAFISFNLSWITYVVFVLCCLALQNGLFGGAGGAAGGDSPAPSPGVSVGG